jgi:23S rRNA (uracil1939-C5)-methyltransferase
MLDFPWYRRVSLPTEEVLTIEKLVYGGDGLARASGRVVLTPFVLPGETVRVEVERVKNDLFRGKLIEVIASSSERVNPPCPYYLRCGGCHYQHIAYEAQVEHKRAILREVLRRVGRIEYEGEIEALAGEPWQYRNRVQLHIEDGEVGYYEQGSRGLCPIESCAVASPALNLAISALSKAVPHVRTTVELFTNEIETQVNITDRLPKAAFEQFAALGSNGPIEYQGCRVSRNSFFQVNRFMVDKLVECALGSYAGETAVDLYAGVGLFAVRLADRFKRVTAVESGWSAFRDLEYNIQRRALEITAQNANAEDYLASLDSVPDLILADPPRAGLGKRAVGELKRIRAPHLCIVSCDPATLARDLQSLLSGGYRIGKITLVDLFPQTFHLETVVELAL